MKRTLNLQLCLLGGGLLLGAAHVSWAQTDAQSKLFALFGNEVIARGEGFEIKRGVLDESVVTIRSSAAGSGNTIGPEATQRLEREVLRRLINIELLTQRATEEDRAKGKQEADSRIAKLLERAGSEEAMARQLKAVGLTPERLKAKLTEEAIAEKVLERELNIQISDEQVRKYYEENPARFEQPEMVRAAHILLTTRDPATNSELSATEKEAKLRKIESLLARARNGADFAELAVEFSDDIASKDRGGEYTFPRGRMAPTFEAAAFSLAPGKISDVVTTQYGYHIIKVYEQIPAKTLPLDDKVTEEVRNFLKTQETQKQMQPLMEKFMAESKVVILDESLKPQPGDNPVPTEPAPAGK
jgi:parvulin-like peptidyl-prolyl isomerase